MFSSLLFGACHWLYSEIGQGCILGPSFTSGWVGPQTVLPGLMVPLMNYIQSKPCTGLYDQLGTQAVLLDQTGTTACTPKLGGGL